MPANRTKLMVAFGVIVAGVLAVLAIGLWLSLTRVTEDDVESEISRALPPGSSQQEIFDFLDRKGADYTDHPGPAEPYLYLEQRGVPPDTMVISAILRNTGWALFGRAHLKIWFILREDGTLERFFVDEVYDAI